MEKVELALELELSCTTGFAEGGLDWIRFDRLMRCGVCFAVRIGNDIGTVVMTDWWQETQSRPGMFGTIPVPRLDPEILPFCRRSWYCYCCFCSCCLPTAPVPIPVQTNKVNRKKTKISESPLPSNYWWKLIPCPFCSVPFCIRICFQNWDSKRTYVREGQGDVDVVCGRICSVAVKNCTIHDEGYGDAKSIQRGRTFFRIPEQGILVPNKGIVTEQGHCSERLLHLRLAAASSVRLLGRGQKLDHITG